MSEGNSNPNLPPKSFGRRCVGREDTIIKAFELFQDTGTNVFVLFHTHDNRYRGFTSQPDRDFPPSNQHLAKRVYPLPEILNPGTVVGLLKKRSKGRVQADRHNLDVQHKAPTQGISRGLHGAMAQKSQHPNIGYHRPAAYQLGMESVAHLSSQQQHPQQPFPHQHYVHQHHAPQHHAPQHHAPQHHAPPHSQQSFAPDTGYYRPYRLDIEPVAQSSLMLHHVQGQCVSNPAPPPADGLPWLPGTLVASSPGSRDRQQFPRMLRDAPTFHSQSSQCPPLKTNNSACSSSSGRGPTSSTISTLELPPPQLVAPQSSRLSARQATMSLPKDSRINQRRNRVEMVRQRRRRAASAPLS